MAQVWLRLEGIAQQHGVADALQMLIRVCLIRVSALLALWLWGLVGFCIPPIASLSILFALASFSFRSSKQEMRQTTAAVHLPAVL